MTSGHKNENFSIWNFWFHQNTTSSHKYELELGVPPFTYDFRPNLYYMELHVHQTWLQAKFLLDGTSCPSNMTSSQIFTWWNFWSIKHGFRPLKNDIFNWWNFRFHQNQIRLRAVNKNCNYRFRRDDFRSSLYWNGRFHKKQNIRDKNKMKKIILLSILPSWVSCSVRASCW